MNNTTTNNENINSRINEYYQKILDKINNIDEKPINSKSVNTRSNLKELTDRVGFIENEAKIIKWFLGICIGAMVICIGGIVVDICRDNSIQSSFNEKEIKILDNLKDYQYKIIKLEERQNSYEKYIDEKIKNKFIESELEFYKGKSNNGNTNIESEGKK